MPHNQGEDHIWPFDGFSSEPFPLWLWSLVTCYLAYKVLCLVGRRIQAMRDQRPYDPRNERVWTSKGGER